jgi:methylated-DNA-protein-cysteine methyltransferase related protein
MGNRHHGRPSSGGPLGGLRNVRRFEAIEAQDAAFEEVIRSIPPGRVATYGQVADAAGYPRYHRQVARFLRSLPMDDIPWQRVIGAGGEIKTRGSAAVTQRALLEGEGVTFVRDRVDLAVFGHRFGDWD